MFRPLPKLLTALVCFAIIAVVAVTNALAQDCESMSGRARTDCIIGQARISGQQSEIAAGAARVRTSEERLRAVTGGAYKPKSHKTKSHRKIPLKQPKAEMRRKSPDPSF